MYVTLNVTSTSLSGSIVGANVGSGVIVGTGVGIGLGTGVGYDVRAAGSGNGSVRVRAIWLARPNVVLDAQARKGAGCGHLKSGRVRERHRIGSSHNEGVARAVTEHDESAHRQRRAAGGEDVRERRANSRRVVEFPSGDVSVRVAEVR